MLFELYVRFHSFSKVRVTEYLILNLLSEHHLSETAFFKISLF